MEEREHGSVLDLVSEVNRFIGEGNDVELLKRDFSVEIDEIGIEFLGQTVRLSGNITIDLEA
jgi:hypothetical protein